MQGFVIGAAVNIHVVEKLGFGIVSCTYISVARTSEH